MLAARPVKILPDELACALLDGISKMGLEVLGWTDEARQLVARIRFLARAFPDQGWPDLTAEHLQATVTDWLAPFLIGCRSKADLARLNPAPALLAMLDWPQQGRLDELAPQRIRVPSGSNVRLDYDSGDIPVLAVKLQELFGLADTPKVAGGKVPVLIHLLSPARRPLQVTQDLRNFWDSVYPEVKKELKGRYPKHPWPDDPWNAVATRHTKRRQRGKG